MTQELVSTGTVEVEYEIYKSTVDDRSVYWWEAANGNFEEDEYYVSQKDAIRAVETYFRCSRLSIAVTRGENMTVNPNNYEGATVTLVGRAGGDAEYPAYDKSGERGISQVRVAVGQGYKKDGEWVDTGTVWYTVSGRTDDIGHVRKGDKVRVDEARLEAREFERKDGTTGQAFETRFGAVTVLESKAGAASADIGSPF